MLRIFSLNISMMLRIIHYGQTRFMLGLQRWFNFSNTLIKYFMTISKILKTNTTIILKTKIECWLNLLVSWWTHARKRTHPNSMRTGPFWTLLYVPLRLAIHLYLLSDALLFNKPGDVSISLSSVSCHSKWAIRVGGGYGNHWFISSQSEMLEVQTCD